MFILILLNFGNIIHHYNLYYFIIFTIICQSNAKIKIENKNIKFYDIVFIFETVTITFTDI